MAVFTAVQNGNWSDAATWGGTPPEFGGDVDLGGFTITVDVNPDEMGLLTNGTLVPVGIRAIKAAYIAGTVKFSGQFGVSTPTGVSLLFPTPPTPPLATQLIGGETVQGVESAYPTPMALKVTKNGPTSGVAILAWNPTATPKRYEGGFVAGGVGTAVVVTITWASGIWTYLLPYNNDSFTANDPTGLNLPMESAAWTPVGSTPGTLGPFVKLF